MDFAAARARLIRDLSADIADRRVLEAMRRVPRERFVPPDCRHAAYQDRPLPIGHEQTISQPYIIALMTEALALNGSEKVLEVGTGSGYQTAILAEIARQVISTERLPALADAARLRLNELGYQNIEVRAAEETLGWQAQAPYAAIMVTAAAPGVPEDLLAQLAIGGHMVIPVGSRHMQRLFQIIRRPDRNYFRNLGGCRFVSLIGRGAWEEQQTL